MPSRLPCQSQSLPRSCSFTFEHFRINNAMRLSYPMPQLSMASSDSRECNPTLRHCLGCPSSGCCFGDSSLIRPMRKRFLTGPFPSNEPTDEAFLGPLALLHNAEPHNRWKTLFAVFYQNRQKLIHDIFSNICRNYAQVPEPN